MGADWKKQTRRVLTLAVLALLLAAGGLFGPVAVEQVVGGHLVSTTHTAHACGSQGGGC